MSRVGVGGRSLLAGLHIRFESATGFYGGTVRIWIKGEVMVSDGRLTASRAWTLKVQGTLWTATTCIAPAWWRCIPPSPKYQ
jgi:hypothetical protein